MEVFPLNPLEEPPPRLLLRPAAQTLRRSIRHTVVTPTTRRRRLDQHRYRFDYSGQPVLIGVKSAVSISTTEPRLENQSNSTHANTRKRDAMQMLPVVLSPTSFEIPPADAASTVDQLAAKAAEAGLTAVPASADFDAEDWIEEVSRRIAILEAATRRSLPILAAPPHDYRPCLDLRTFCPASDNFLPPPRRVSAARITPYGRNPVFVANAARKIVAVSGDSDAFPGLPEFSATVASAEAIFGTTRLIWKADAGLPKQYPIERIDTRSPVDPGLLFGAYHAGVSILQEEVDMLCETRFFVVDHAVISGAAAIEADTPLNRPADCASRLPPRFERRRNSGEIINQPALAARMLQHADHIAAAFAATNLPPDFTLDLFLNAKTDKIGVVEINPINASGLYGIAPAPVFDALVAALAARADQQQD